MPFIGTERLRKIEKRELMPENTSYLTILLTYRLNNRTYASTKCRCGVTKSIRLDSVLSRDTISCGCYARFLTSKRSYKHGMSFSPEYKALKNAKDRCYNKNNKRYKHYGGRGIKVCHRWKDSFINFFKDMGTRPKNRTLDRINNNGNYTSFNCRWATYTQQNNNRNYKGVLQCPS